MKNHETPDSGALVSSPVLAGMLLSAFRYALGRSTYIVQETRTWMEAYWPLLHRWHKQIHDDIRAAIEREQAGMDCDVDEWRMILALPVSGQAIGLSPKP